MARQANPRVRARIANNLSRLLGTRENGVAAKLMGMSQAQLSGYAHGHRGFSIETLLRFAVMLECSLDDLVNGVDVEYSRHAMRRVHAELEGDDELLDVITGFAMIRMDNPREAGSIAAMFRSRMLSFAGPVPQDAARDAETSTAAAETFPRKVRRPAAPRRDGR